ncbi:MAG: TRAM domain-containing protein [Firmicutes bacterium]|nr:TRAM domain-containing protein [Bacillota bacterium]
MFRLIRGMFSIIFIVFGGLLGYSIASHTEGYYKMLTPILQFANLWALVGLGMLLGAIIAPHFSNLFMRISDTVVTALHRYTLQEIVMGSVGLIFGLIIAAIIILILSFIPFSKIPIAGDFIGPLAYTIVAIFWAYLGVYFAARLSFMQSLGSLFGGKKNQSSIKSSKIFDTSVIIDGRIADIIKAGFIEGNLIIPKFVLEELQQIADSSDAMKRNRGRRGLDVLNALRKDPGIEIHEKNYPETAVDGKLVKLAQELKSSILTTDFNLNKVAQIHNIKVLNINELANAMRPVVLPGEEMTVSILKEGKEREQGVAYLEDGTMVVIEDGKKRMGETIPVEVTSVLQTVAGKMIFAKIK